MLRIYSVVLDVIRQLRPTMAVIDRKDRDLGRQLRRCSASVGQNLGEGMYSRGRNRAAKYHVALGSAREMRTRPADRVVTSWPPACSDRCGGVCAPGFSG